MQKVLCSTGTSIGRPNGRDFRLLEECARQVECDSWEFMMYDSWYGREEEIVRFATSLPVSFPTFHCEKSIGERISRDEPGDMQEAIGRFEKNCKMARQMGASLMVLHLWNGPISDSNIEANMRAFGALETVARENDVRLTVENVVCAHKDPLTHMKRLAQMYPDILFTFDTKMAKFHGQMAQMLAPENDWLWRHIAHIHANDFSGAPGDWNSLKTLHIGRGQVDFQAMIDCARRNGYRGDFTIEATSFDQSGRIHFDELNGSIGRLRALMKNAN